MVVILDYQYGICAEVRHGDFLAANVHQWHCNTEFTPVINKSEDEIVEINKNFCYDNNIKFTKNSEKKLRNNIKNDWHYNRLSWFFIYEKICYDVKILLILKIKLKNKY